MRHILIWIYIMWFSFTSGFVFKKPWLKYRTRSLMNHNMFSDVSFHGIWKLNSNKSNVLDSEIINLCPNGKLESPSELHVKLYGFWYTNDMDLTLVMVKHNSSVSYVYQGCTLNNSIKVNGQISYGCESPDHIGNFHMEPIFPMFHNITVNNQSNKVKINSDNVTGNWLLENTYTKNIIILSIHPNYTWNSYHYTNNIPILGGIWNLYDSDKMLDITSGIHDDGDYIWLLAEKLSSKSINRLNLISNILYLGKITHLGKYYLQSDESPCSEDSNTEIVASKINGTILYGYEDEPDISESFYMKRWWN